MDEDILVKIFEHNNWANQRIIEACSALSDKLLDMEPHSVTKGNIRETLIHLAASQRGYLALLISPSKARPTSPISFAELEESIRTSGEGLLALANGSQAYPNSRFRTSDGFLVEPWVVMLQVINHATERREQIKSMLSSLGVTPPEIDFRRNHECSYSSLALTLVKNSVRLLHTFFL
jgi:uncharacterized damage-inducible protein DinB